MDTILKRFEGWLWFLPNGVRDSLIKSLRISYTVISVTIPIVIIIRILSVFGLVDVLADGIQPIMSMLHLPGEAALVWAATITANLYAGLITFVALGGEFTILQATVLACLMLGTHNIFVEMMFVAKTGCRVIPFTVLRIGMTILSAYFVGMAMDYMDVGSDPATVMFVPTMETDVSWSEWAYNTALQIGFIPIIAFVMIALIDILKHIGVTNIISKALSPMLSPLKIKSNDACQLTLVGVLLGLAFGGALLVEEAKKGHIPNRDISIVMLLLCNVHAAIEDNILLALLGAWLWGFVILRIAICYIMMMLFGYVVTKMNDAVFYKHIFKRP